MIYSYYNSKIEKVKFFPQTRERRQPMATLPSQSLYGSNTGDAPLMLVNCLLIAPYTTEKLTNFSTNL